MHRISRRPLAATASVLVALATAVAMAPPAGANAPLRQQERTTSLYCTGSTVDGRELNLYVQADPAQPELEVDLSVSVPDSEEGETWFGTGRLSGGVVDVRVPLGAGGSGPVAVFTGTYTADGDPILLRDHLRMDNWTLSGHSVFQPLQLTWSTFDLASYAVASAQCDAMSHELDDRWSQPHRTVVREGQPAIAAGADCAASPVTSVTIYPAEVQYLMVVSTPTATGYAFVSPDRGTDTGRLQWVADGSDEVASSADVTVTMARDGQPRHTTTVGDGSTVVTTTTPQQLGISTQLADGSPWSVSCSADLVSQHVSTATPAAS